MKAFQTTCCILAILALTTQGIRHAYLKYFEPTTSVLDRFDKKVLTTEIEQAESLDALVAKYEPARKRADELDLELKKQAEARPEEGRDEFRREYRDQHDDEYQPANDLRSAIINWETKSKEIRELRIFWTFGLGLLLVGGLFYLKWPWLGMALVVPGVVEMIWWTSPTFRFLGGAEHEYDRLLNNKLGFTIASLLLVLIAWYLASRLRREPRI